MGDTALHEVLNLFPTETIPPKYTAGKSFIIFPITNGSKDNYITVVAMEVYTVITVHRAVKQDTYLASAGESTKVINRFYSFCFPPVFKPRKNSLAILLIATLKGGKYYKRHKQTRKKTL